MDSRRMGMGMGPIEGNSTTTIKKGYMRAFPLTEKKDAASSS